jgi:hypothetical protein
MPLSLAASRRMLSTPPPHGGKNAARLRRVAHSQARLLLQRKNDERVAAQTRYSHAWKPGVNRYKACSFLHFDALLCEAICSDLQNNEALPSSEELMRPLVGVIVGQEHGN